MRPATAERNDGGVDGDGGGMEDEGNPAAKHPARTPCPPSPACFQVTHHENSLKPRVSTACTASITRGRSGIDLRVSNAFIIMGAMTNENISNKDMNKAVVDDLKEYFQAEGEVSGTPVDAYMFAYGGNHPWRTSGDGLPSYAQSTPNPDCPSPVHLIDTYPPFDGDAFWNRMEEFHRKAAYDRIGKAITDADGFNDAKTGIRSIAMSAGTPGESMMALRALQALQLTGMSSRETTLVDMPALLLHDDGILNALSDFNTPISTIVDMIADGYKRLTSDAFVRESYEVIDNIMNVNREWIIEHCWLGGGDRAARERRFDEHMKGEGVPWGLIGRDRNHLLAYYIIDMDDFPLELELIEDMLPTGTTAPDERGIDACGYHHPNGFETPERIGCIIGVSGGDYIGRHDFQSFIELIALHPEIMRIGMNGVINLTANHFEEYNDVDMRSLSKQGLLTYLLIANAMGLIPNEDEEGNADGEEAPEAATD